MTEPLRPLAQLLLDSVRIAAGTAYGPLDPRLATVTPAQVAAAAALHRVTPAVAVRVEREADAPEAWRESLRSARHTQLIRHLQARTDLGVVAEALDAAAIPWVAVKGPVTSDLLWPRPDLREYFDLDLVVDRRRWTDVLVALEAIGCRYVDRNWPLLRRTMRAELALTGPLGTPIDLHWDIAVPQDLRRKFAIDMAAMLGRRRSARLGNNLSTWVLDPADTVFHLAFHAALAGGGRLVWAADVWFAARQLCAEDWDQLHLRTRAYRAELPMALLLAQAVRLLGPIPDLDQRLLEPARGWWGRMVAARDRRYPQPGLPGDAHLGGTFYSSARSSLAASALEALRGRWRLHHLERPGRTETESDALARDVPDDAARLDYQHQVQSAAQP